MVNSVFRAAEILSMLSLGRNRLTDICQELGLSKGTVHRLLKTLEQCGFVFLDPVTHQYYLGHLMIKISSNPDISHQNLIVCAYDELKMLRDKSGETAALFIPIGNRRICLEEIDSNNSIRLVVQKGSVHPIYSGSSGKVLLSQFSDEALMQLLDNTPLVKIAKNTITNRKVLLQEVEKTKKKGYAVSTSETLDGAYSICVPIKDYSCPVALSILGPQDHFESNSNEFVKIMKDSAMIINKKIKKNSVLR